jgi:hypothetical protein
VGWRIGTASRLHRLVLGFNDWVRGFMTPLRSIRVSADLWQAVKIKANANESTITNVIISALRDYLKD